MVRYHGRFFALLLLLLIVLRGADIGAEEPVSSRWAVVFPTAWTDLVTAELSKKEGIELVERLDVDKAIREHDLSVLSQSSDVASRLRLGRILKADRLLVLTKKPKSAAGQEEYRLVVLDTSLGLLLFAADLDFSRHSIESICETTSDIVDRINRRYRNGIKAIVDVSYFVSKSFDRSFDPFQAGFSELVRDSLLRQDGIAVVALEELASVQKESALTGNDRLSRIVRLSVSGTFTVHDPPGPEPRISISVTIGDGKTPLDTLEKENATLREIGGFLSGEIPKRIFQQMKTPHVPISVEAQKRQFLQNAELLLAVGAAELALRNREAAFFLDPDDLENTVDMLVGPDRIRDRYRALPYMEYLFRSKKPSLVVGMQIVKVLFKTAPAQRRIPGIQYKTPFKEPTGEEDPLNLLNNVGFMCRIVPLLVELPPYSPEFKKLFKKRWDWIHPKGMIYPDYTNRLLSRKDQYCMLANLIENAIYGRVSEFDGFNGMNPERMKDYVTKEPWERFFKLRRMLPKDIILSEPEFFPMGRMTVKKTGPNPHRDLMTSIDPELWQYYCELWRETKDEDFLLLADLHELNWLTYNRSKLKKNEWKQRAIPIFNRISAQYWKQTRPGVFEPVKESQQHLLAYISGLESVAGLSQYNIEYVEVRDKPAPIPWPERPFSARAGDGRSISWPERPVPGPNIQKSFEQEFFAKPARKFIVRKNSSPKAPPSRPIKTFAERYMEIVEKPPREPADRYIHVKNSRVSLSQIEDWGVPTARKDMGPNGLIEEPRSREEQIKQYWKYIAEYERNSFSGMISPFSPFSEPENRPGYLERLDETTDIYSDFYRIFRITKGNDGRLKCDRIFNIDFSYTKQAYICCVRCDGRNLWVSYDGGVDVLSPNGRKLARFDQSDGLPENDEYRNEFAPAPVIPDGKPMDGIMGLGSRFYTQNLHGVSIAPTAVGEALVLGRHGALRQTWIGKMKFDAVTGKKSFKILHRTTRNLPSDKYLDENHLNAVEQMDVIFSCPWFCRFADSKFPKRRQILVARKYGFGSHPIHASPILVDMDSEKVMLLYERYPDLEELKGAVAAECVNDVFVLRRGGFRIELYFRGDDGKYRSREIVNPIKDQEGRWGGILGGSLFSLGNSVYVPGSSWYRIDVSGKEPVSEIIGDCDSTIPPFDKLLDYASSAHFGIWVQPERGTPWKLEEKPVDMPLSPFRDVVPADKLARHDAAVQKLESLGAKVCFGSTYHRIFFRDGQWHEGFSVSITPDWKGTNADLALLGDIDRLCSVGIVNVDVGDEGFEHLKGINTICELFLLRSNITEKAVLEFPLGRLTRLFLEDDPDTVNFTDQVVEAVRNSKNMKVLGLSGPGISGGTYEYSETN